MASTTARALLAALVLSCAAPAAAQTGLAPAAVPPGPPPAGEWRVSIGAGLLLAPDYLGSRDLQLRPVVAPEIRLRDDALFLSFRDGLGATLLREGGLSGGVLLRPRFGRDQDDNPALRGMGDIDFTAEAGAFLAYAEGPWRARLELRRGFGGHEGVVADARLDRVFRPRPDLILTAGPRLSWGDAEFSRTYFGVDARQAARSGYARFSPGDYWFGGVAAGATWLATDRWSVALFGEVGRIVGDASDSPLVRRGSETQGVLGLAVSWRLSP